MKPLLIFLVVLVGIFLWRSNRERDPKRKREQRPDAPQPLAMVCCALCSVHVPALEGVQGKNGVYCCADHLRRAEP